MGKRRIHLFVNGDLSKGKVLVYDKTVTFDDLKLSICKKLQIQLSSKLRIYTSRGSEIDAVLDIFHDDVLMIEQFGRKFLPYAPYNVIFGHTLPSASFHQDNLEHIFVFLDQNTLINTVSLVCKDWNSIVQNDDYWKHLTMIHLENCGQFQEVDKITNLRMPANGSLYWKVYYSSLLEWKMKLKFDEKEHGPNIIVDDQTISRLDEIDEWQTIRLNLPINIPPISEKTEINSLPINTKIYSWKFRIDELEPSLCNNPWSIIVGIERSSFPWTKSHQTQLIGYGKNTGYGLALGNGDRLHSYASTSKFLMTPIEWKNPKILSGDIIEILVIVDLDLMHSARMECVINGENIGSPFNSFAGKFYPAISILTCQKLTLID